MVNTKPTAATQEAPPTRSDAPLCRFPAECDLSDRLKGMDARLEHLEIQLGTLVGLLGGAVRVGLHDEKKAG